MSLPTTTATEVGNDWRAVAEELAGALQETMLRNPSLTARTWDRAHAALGRYERASGVVGKPVGIPGAPEA
jgi:hypothetical protein